MTIFGPDVSKWQEGLVPPVPHGIRFGICRATKGVEVDPVVDNVIAWCRTNNVPFCAYHFCVPLSVQTAKDQADAFYAAIGKDKSIPCMLDWERSSEGWEPSFGDALAVIDAIRQLGSKVALLYTGYWYWELKGRPSLAGHGFDLVNANYDNTKTGNAQTIYASRGGDAGPGWNGYGSLTPVIWQFTDRATWGNKTLDMNAYRGDPTLLGHWFTTWNKETTVATFPYGYKKDESGVAGMGTLLTIEQLEAKTTVAKLHPEFWRRYKALIQFAAENGIHLGVGTGWRIQPTNPDGSAKPGFALPGNSNHEGFPADGVTGGAVAIDTVTNASWPWMEKNLARYGLRSFVLPSTTGYKGTNEPWHIQPYEIPASRMRRSQPWKLNAYPLPTGPAPTPIPPTPTPKPPATVWSVELMKVMPIVLRGNKGTPVKRVQHFLALAGEFDATNMANFDGVFGSGTEAAVRRFQTSHKILVDGIVDTEVWDLFCEASNGIPGLVKGNAGVDVQRMQRMLSANGQMDPSNQGNFDGQFGSGTESAVKKFQSAKGLNADGKCGQKTWTSLLNG